MLFARQSGLCPNPEFGGCGKPLDLLDRLEVDHLIPLSSAKDEEEHQHLDQEWNWQVMHWACNRAKGSKILLC
jgi:5-methylcytosine-specific restriction endonuclease McrA